MLISGPKTTKQTENQKVLLQFAEGSVDSLDHL